ncbi:MAG: hypothetical protein KDE04_14080, partial [Anaerolineales bacterium]|nr:hypothetical protein [Anaerolineales bacterium]
VILVLDDYHLADAPQIDNVLAFLVEHAPPQLHIAILTRGDPNLPLARWRVRNLMTEIRAKDLRFDEVEAAEFLGQVFGQSLSPENCASLATRTEGWIAGLQLAALSMQGQQDLASFVRDFSGDNRYVVDYLVEEVLLHQPEATRQFLLQTAILDRLNGSLCEAVTGLPDGRARLEALERGNFFLVPLDNKRDWYRYHHLFAAALRARLAAGQPEQISSLNRRASDWYAEQGLRIEAIRYAFAAKDFDRAADLMELAWPDLRRSRQEALMLRWGRQLPEEQFPTRPVLAVAYAGALLVGGEIRGIDERLRDAEKALEWVKNNADPAGANRPAIIIRDEAEFRRLPGWIAVYRAALALASGNLAGARAYAWRVLEVAAVDDHLLRGPASGLLGLALWTNGELSVAQQIYAEGMTHLRLAGNVADAVGGVLALADIRIAQGRLRAARQIYEQALQLAQEQGAPTLRGTADMYVGLSELSRELNDLLAAREYLAKARAQGEHTGFPQYPYRWRVAMAQLQAAAGEFGGALDLLAEAERHYVPDFFPNVRPIAALQARLWLARGELAAALDWARGQGLSTADETVYMREYEHITLARLLLAQYRSNGQEPVRREVISFLDRLLRAADEGGRVGSAIEILLLQASVYQASDNLPAATAALARALTLAEPEGYVRIFLEQGLSMAPLLREVITRGIRPAYAERLLRNLPGESMGEEAPAGADVSLELIEPLSPRELAVLHLLGSTMSGPEIAAELMVALSTIRTHTKSIYGKLNVNNRRAAVKRAEELKLI